MGQGGTNVLLILIVIGVAIAVAAWLIHFIFRIHKMKKAYQEILKERQEKDEKEPAAAEDKTQDKADSKEPDQGSQE